MAFTSPLPLSNSHRSSLSHSQGQHARRRRLLRPTTTRRRPGSAAVPKCVSTARFSGKLPENGTTASSSSTPASAPAPQPQEPGMNGARNANTYPPQFGPKSVEAAIEAVARGEFIVVTDDENRENEGDLIIAADKVTPAAIAFMVRHTSGVICASMEEADLDRLQLEQMVVHNTDPKNTAFTVSVDLKAGNTTGISAADRCRTLQALARKETTASELNRPGHIFPLRYKEGGVLKRAGHTEAALDFARLAGCAPVGVLSEIVDDKDGEMARLPLLRTFAETHGLVLTSIADLVQYRRQHETLVEMVGEGPARLPTKYGEFEAYAFKSVLDGVEHLAVVKRRDAELASKTEEGNNDSNLSEGIALNNNNIANGTNNKKNTKHKFDKPVLVRVHSECCTGDVFGSLRCDCGPQLEFAMRKIAEEGEGVLIYLRGQEGRGIGLGHKMRAYALQDRGFDTVQANLELGLPNDTREYGIGAQMLATLGVEKIRVMTNNPAKYSGLGGYGLTIVERVPVQISPNPENVNYLRTKQQKMGHWLNMRANGSMASKNEISPPGTGLPNEEDNLRSSAVDMSAGE